MSWWRRLFRKTNENPFALTDDIFPESMKRRVRPPSRSRSLTEAEKAADLIRYTQEMQAQNADIWAFNRTRVEKIGCTKYIWRSSQDSDVCDLCRRNNGKRFSYATAPKGGHPGDGHLCSTGEVCRCYAEPVIPN